MWASEPGLQSQVTHPGQQPQGEGRGLALGSGDNGGHDRSSVLPGRWALPLAGRQNELRALVAEIPPGRQHGQAGLAAGRCPQQHPGPRPLASEWKRLREQYQEHNRQWHPEPCRRVPGEVFCAHPSGKQATRPIRIAASLQKQPQAVGQGWAATSCISIC